MAWSRTHITVTGRARWSPRRDANKADRETKRRTDRNINASWHWTPTLEGSTNKNRKRPADDRTDRRTNIRTYYTPTQEIWTCGLWPHALRTIKSCTNDFQKVMQTTSQRDRDTDIYSGLDPHWGLLDPSVGINIFVVVFVLV